MPIASGRNIACMLVAQDTGHVKHIHTTLQYKCAGNSITRSMAFTGMCVTLKDGSTVLYPECPGWTQAINTLGLAANPSAQQLTVEKPTMRTPTRAVNQQLKKEGMSVDAVYVFKVLSFVVLSALTTSQHSLTRRVRLASRRSYDRSPWT